jgi:hypothetical protein
MCGLLHPIEHAGIVFKAPNTWACAHGNKMFPRPAFGKMAIAWLRMMAFVPNKFTSNCAQQRNRRFIMRDF